MLTAKTQYNLKNAKEYFEEHLCVGDYYDEGQRVAGEWFRMGAAQLGLTGMVGAEAFSRLCENRHPASGETLTQRLNTTRTDETNGNSADRRIFMTSRIISNSLKKKTRGNLQDSRHPPRTQ